MYKVIFEKWIGNRVFSAVNHKKAWKENGNKPQIYFHENGGRKKHGDKCFDMSLIVGYTVFNYCNYSLNQKKKTAI